MAKVVKTTYQCDVCKKEYDKEEYLRTVELPYKESDFEGRHYHTNLKRFDLCESCYERYTNLVFENFATIRDTVGYWEVEVSDQGKE